MTSSQCIQEQLYNMRRRMLICTMPKFSKRPIGGLIMCILLVTIGYYVYILNVWEYMRTTPFTYFKYPLEVDMPELVKKVLNHQPTGVEPLNDRHAYPFVLNADKKCKDEDGNEDAVFLLILIKSRMENFEQRRTIRRTWGREFGVASVSIRHIFLLGIHPTDKKLQHKIGLEQQVCFNIVHCMLLVEKSAFCLIWKQENFDCY